MLSLRRVSRKLSSSGGVIFVFLILFFLIQSFFMTAPYVNLEYLYGTATMKIAEHGFSTDISYLDYYFRDISNPLFTSMMSAPLVHLFGFSEYLTRLPVVLLSLLLIWAAYSFVDRFLNRRAAIMASLLLTFNVLFWSFSNKAYTDVPFTVLVSLSIMSLIYSLSERKILFSVLSGLMISLAFITKIIANIVYPLFLMIFVLYFVGQKRESVSFYIKKAILHFSPYLVFSLVMILPYFLMMLDTFGFIMHPGLVNLVFKDGIMLPFIIRFLGYLSWLGIFVFLLTPIIIFDFHKNSLRRFPWSKCSIYLMILLFNALVLFITRNKLHFMGEMDFGGFDALLPGFMISMILYVALFVGEILVVNMFFWTRSSFVKRSLFTWLVFLTFAISIARPTQRYLMIVLIPLVIYLADRCTNLRQLTLDKRLRAGLSLFVYANISLLVLMCLFVSAYQQSLGEASAEIAHYVNDHDIVAGLEFEPKSHSYYLFEDQGLYPLEDVSLALRNYSRPYFAGPINMINTDEYEVIYSVTVESFWIRIKEFAVARRIDAAES